MYLQLCLTFNSLYGIPKNTYVNKSLQNLLSIPFMGYSTCNIWSWFCSETSFNSLYGIRYTWYYKGKRTLYFQFPLWDTLALSICLATHLSGFQFPLWDTFCCNSRIRMAHCSFNSLYGIRGNSGYDIEGYFNKLSIPFMGYLKY